MYEEIVWLIEAQLERLHRARALLAGAESAELPQEKTEPKKTQPGPQLGPTVQRVAAREAPVRRGGRTPKKPAVRAGALQGTTPLGVIAIPASEVERSMQARQEAMATPEAVAVKEGTLDALVQQLSGEGKRSSESSKATSFPFSLEDS